MGLTSYLYSRKRTVQVIVTYLQANPNKTELGLSHKRELETKSTANTIISTHSPFIVRYVFFIVFSCATTN